MSDAEVDDVAVHELIETNGRAEFISLSGGDGNGLGLIPSHCGVEQEYSAGKSTRKCQEQNENTLSVGRRQEIERYLQHGLQPASLAVVGARLAGRQFFTADQVAGPDEIALPR
jgi:hypothetical protein